MFNLTQGHLDLLRQATVLWNPTESGAPAILISPLEIGGAATAEDIQADIALRARLGGTDRPGAADLLRAQQLRDQLPEALARMLAHGKLSPGRYEYANPIGEFQHVAFLPTELNSLATDKTVVFEFTDQHAALLRGAQWEGLFMNPKRPYGDMTYFELDMAAILHQPASRDENGSLPSSEEQQLWKLHTQTLPALQVYLQRASISPGTYH